MPGKTPTFCKRIWIVFVVFKPEAVSELEVVKLSGQDARKRRSKHRSCERVFGNAGWPEINIVHMSVHNMHIQHLTAVVRNIFQWGSQWRVVYVASE